MNNLEQLLSAPMHDINDRGFSIDVIEKIAKFNHRRNWFLNSLYSTLSLIFITFFPIFNWLETFKTFIFNQDYATASMHFTSQALMESISQPVIILALTMIFIFIFTRLES